MQEKSPAHAGLFLFAVGVGSAAERSEELQALARHRELAVGHGLVAVGGILANATVNGVTRSAVDGVLTTDLGSLALSTGVDIAELARWRRHVLGLPTAEPEQPAPGPEGPPPDTPSRS